MGRKVLAVLLCAVLCVGLSCPAYADGPSLGDDNGNGSMIGGTDWSFGEDDNPSTPETPDPGPDNPDPGPDTPDPGPDKPNPGPDTPDPGPDKPNPGPETPDPGPDKPNPGPETPDPGPENPGPEKPDPDPGPAEPGGDIGSDSTTGSDSEADPDSAADSGSKKEDSDPVTIPVSGGDVTVSASVSGSTATVSEIDLKEIESAANGGSEAGMIEIDFTGLKNAISTVELPAASIGEIAKAAKAEDSGVKGMTVKLSGGAVSFDGSALAAIQEQSASQVSLSVAPVKAAELNSRQQKVVGTAPVFELTLKSGDTVITDFGDGHATVSLPYTLEKGQDPSNVVVYYLDDSGNIHACETMYDVRTETVIFTTGHFSLYYVGYAAGTASEGQPEAEENPFSDVPSGAYYYDAVLWAVASKITNGTGTATFSPEAPCTRGQIVTFLWRAAGSPAVSGSNPFADVSTSDYWYDAVLWAVSKGITNGTSANTFSPNDACTRGQTVTFLYRNAGTPEASDATGFTDVLPGAYYSDAVSWAVANKITNGLTASGFGPEETCTRGQIVTFLYRDLEN